MEEYKKGILEGDRTILAKAITLVESTLPHHQQLAGEVVEAIFPCTGNSIRVGITGAPGVGKSTFIESLGKALIASGRKVAVLTIDPSSQLTGGSILGDKTRMQELAKDPRAFIRPSPSGQTLGGVAAHTRETILLCEAAGFDFIIVETVGTGQSEIAVKSMVDFFLLLMLPGSGDELQGIKKGIVEMADAIGITKADGENLPRAQATQADFEHALHLLQPPASGWIPKVVSCSALRSTGIPDIMELIEQYYQQMLASGYLQMNRSDQQTYWFQQHFQYLLSIDPKRFKQLEEEEQKLKRLVDAQELSPRAAARQLLNRYHQEIRK
jgi:LAO/AO transport system kinase